MSQGGGAGAATFLGRAPHRIERFPDASKNSRLSLFAGLWQGGRLERCWGSVSQRRMRPSMVTYAPLAEPSLQFERLPANEWPDYRYEHEEFNQCASLVS
jgi:hypothetical protein